MMRGLEGLEETRFRTEAKKEKEDLALILFHRVYLSLSSAGFVWLDTENPRGEF